jgi:hypothetical protein
MGQGMGDEIFSNAKKINVKGHAEKRIGGLVGLRWQSQHARAAVITYELLHARTNFTASSGVLSGLKDKVLIKL